MNISLTQLRYFSVLARTRHFGRAAHELNISQPPLSRAIASLEDELGTPLFVRSPQGVFLTESGRQFATDVSEIEHLVHRAKFNAQAASKGETGEFRLGFTMHAALNTLPKLAKRFRSRYPAVTFTLREMTPPALQEALEAGEIDLAISFAGLENPQVEALLLFEEPLDLIYSQSHPLANEPQLTTARFAAEEFILIPREQAPRLHDTILSHCHAAGFEPRVAYQVYLQQTVVNLVAEEMGVAFVPRSVKRASPANVCFLAVEQPPVLQQWLYWRNTNTNPCRSNFQAMCAD
ncbi:LysR family transcriptional regulator [Pseudomonas sp. NA-150]|uniref:LysR family transcriptional regulator n=1 Tax=Pseudomonas sp. NA-150 TaxID=3367525 RepID=UPI0037C5E419